MSGVSVDAPGVPSVHNSSAHPCAYRAHLQAVEADESRMLGMDPEQSLARAEAAFDDALAACSAKKDLEALMGKVM